MGECPVRLSLSISVWRKTQDSSMGIGSGVHDWGSPVACQRWGLFPPFLSGAPRASCPLLAHPVHSSQPCFLSAQPSQWQEGVAPGDLTALFPLPCCHPGWFDLLLLSESFLFGALPQASISIFPSCGMVTWSYPSQT